MGVFSLLPAAKAPLFIEVIGAIFVVAAPMYAWISLRTSVTVMPDAVRLTTVRGVTEFAAGDAQVRIGSTQSGLLSTAPLLTLIRLSDNRIVSVPLASFPKAVRATLPDLVRRTLRVTSG